MQRGASGHHGARRARAGTPEVSREGAQGDGDRVVFATQADSTIRALQDGTVAVPFVNLNRVNLWSLPIR